MDKLIQKMSQTHIYTRHKINISTKKTLRRFWNKSCSHKKDLYKINALFHMDIFLPLTTWPSGKLPFDCQKIAKNLTLKKNCQNFSFFSKKLPMAIFLKKMKIFGNFLEKKCLGFGNFLTVKWQFSGGSGC